MPSGELDEGFDDVILACLAKDPAARYGSMRVFLEALLRLMDRLGMSQRRQATPEPAPRRQPADPDCRAMVESNPLPMFSLDPEGRFNLVNESFCLFVKKKAEQLVGLPLVDSRLASFCPGLGDDLQVVLEKNKVTSRELAFSFGEQRTSKVLIWLAPLTVGGIIVGAHGVVHWIEK
jgi:PAS domain-containing protein